MTYTTKEIINMITDAVLDCMRAPSSEYKKQDGTMMNNMDLLNLNTNKLFFNGGVQELAEVLINKLAEGDTDDTERDQNV